MAAIFNTLQIERGRQPARVTGRLEPEHGPRPSGTTPADEKLDNS
jgi:hypothetical protein